MISTVVMVLSLIRLGTCYPPPHPDVVAVRLEEELLPSNLRSPALHNPHLQEILPVSSLLHKGENLVFEREASKVSRKEIYNILSHAGLIPRKKFSASSQGYPFHKFQPIPVKPQHFYNKQNFYDPPKFDTQDYLQHL